MSMTTRAVVFFGVKVDLEASEWDGDWPDDLIAAHVRATLAREPDFNDLLRFGPPHRRWNGAYVQRGPLDDEYSGELSTVFPMTVGYDFGDEPTIYPFVAIRASYQEGDYEGAVFNSAMTHVDAATLALWVQALDQFCRVTKLRHGDASWYLAAYTL